MSKENKTENSISECDFILLQKIKAQQKNKVIQSLEKIKSDYENQTITVTKKKFGKPYLNNDGSITKDLIAEKTETTERENLSSLMALCSDDVDNEDITTLKQLDTRSCNSQLRDTIKL